MCRKRVSLSWASPLRAAPEGKLLWKGNKLKADDRDTAVNVHEAVVSFLFFFKLHCKRSVECTAICILFNPWNNFQVASCGRYVCKKAMEKNWKKKKGNQVKKRNLQPKVILFICVFFIDSVIII